MAPPSHGVRPEPCLPAEVGKCFSQIVLEEVQHGDHCVGHWERRARVEGRSPEMSPQGKWVLEVNEVEGTRLGYYGKVTQGLRTRHGGRRNQSALWLDLELKPFFMTHSGCRLSRFAFPSLLREEMFLILQAELSSRLFNTYLRLLPAPEFVDKMAYRFHKTCWPAFV